MYVELSTLITRTGRNQKSLPLVRVSNLSMAVLVAKYFEEVQVSFALVYRFASGSETDAVTAAALRQLADDCKLDCSLAFVVDPAEVAGKTAEITHTVIVSEKEGWPLEHLPTIGYLPLLPHPDVLASYKEALVAAIVPTTQESSHLRQATTSRLPLIVVADNLATPRLQSYLKAGAVGFYLEDELQFAYTAGLRTALRDREYWEPLDYEAKALHAVKHALRNRVHAIYHH